MAKLEKLFENAGFDKFATRAERFSQVLSHLLSETVERCCMRSRVVEHHDIVALRSELGINLQSSDIHSLNLRVCPPEANNSTSSEQAPFDDVSQHRLKEMQIYIF